MSLSEKRIVPKDVFLTIFDAEEQKYSQTAKNRLSGNEIVDKLAELLSVHGMMSPRRYAKKMGIKNEMLNHFLMLCSGLTFRQWRNEYLILGAKELLIETDLSLDQVGKRLGFTGQSAFGKWFTRIVKDAPSRWRRVAKLEAKKEDEKLLIEAKKKRANTAPFTEINID